MSRKRYKLSTDGIAARNELLSLLGVKLDSNNCFNISEAHETLKLKRIRDRATTFTDLLANPPYYSVALDKITDFFTEILEKVHSRYKGQCNNNCEIHDDTLKQRLSRCILIESPNLRSYFNSQDNWTVHKDFYDDCALTRSRSNIARQSSSPSTRVKLRHSSNPAREIADLLWDLDYRTQQQDFIDNIEEDPSHAIAFSIVAPAPRSDFDSSLQQWLLCRLCRSMENDWLTKATQILIEPPKCKSGDTEWGLIDICQEVEKILLDNGVQVFNNKTDDVIDALAKYSAKHPILIKVNNLHHEAHSKKILIDDFWKKLVARINKIPLSRSMKRSRLIMFVLEDNDNIVRINDGSVYLLNPLDIKFEDVARWAGQEKVIMALTKCDELNEDIDREVDDLINKEIRGWPCWNESRIEIKLPDFFEGLCRRLNSGYSSKRVSEYWKI